MKSYLIWIILVILSKTNNIIWSYDSKINYILKEYNTIYYKKQYY